MRKHFVVAAFAGFAATICGADPLLMPFPQEEFNLRSVEEFTGFEQRTAYFNGDHVSATRKGVNLPDRPNQVAVMAQMKNIIDARVKTEIPNESIGTRA